MHATHEPRRPILARVPSRTDQDAAPSTEPLPTDAIGMNRAVTLSRSSRYSIKRWALQGKLPYWQRAVDGRMQFSEQDIRDICSYQRGPVDEAAAAALDQGAQA